MNTQYVCHLPKNHRDYRLYAIRLERRANGLWAATRGEECLNSDGGWEYELRNSDRAGNQRWTKTHYFDFATIRRMANKAKPHVTVNGRSAADVLAGRTGTPRKVAEGTGPSSVSSGPELIDYCISIKDGARRLVKKIQFSGDEDKAYSELERWASRYPSDHVADLNREGSRHGVEGSLFCFGSLAPPRRR
ncbi:hypothetical protein OHA71_06555 [Streptomyces sp. NBC_00444]|uniref:hypothetical protein n=1 Tax=Streptomyces sp. NBC_00444 TaxID=2975744 RepID=UPI002E202A97